MRIKGKRIRTPDLEVRFLASLVRSARVGIIVPRHSHTAVDRNRVKRRLREIVRVDILPSLEGLSVDVVVRAFPAAYQASFSRLREQCTHVREQLLAKARS